MHARARPHTQGWRERERERHTHTHTNTQYSFINMCQMEAHNVSGKGKHYVMCMGHIPIGTDLL